MNNDLHHQHSLPVDQKLSTLLAVIISFQQKIENLRIKLCGHQDFSPELFYQEIDRAEKGYIDLLDFIAFVKKNKPLFNVDARYLKALFVKFNKDEKVPEGKLTYFGYLNIIKPHFNTEFAKDLLSRDSRSVGNSVNIVVRKLLEELMCTVYVCAAEHERVKELIILGDHDEGGFDQGSLYNIYELLDIVREGSKMRNQNIEQSSQSRLEQSSSRLNFLKLESEVNLNTLYNFLQNKSEFKIEKEELKFLLAYLMCHEYMITNEKNLTFLFMPSCVSYSLIDRKKEENSQIRKETYEMRENGNGKTGGSWGVGTAQGKFLDFVHPGTIPIEELPRERKTIVHKPREVQVRHEEVKSKDTILIENHSLHHSIQIPKEEPRILINAPQNTLQTPVLEKFLRESKVLKNMSRYHPEPQHDQSSAFIQGSLYLNPQEHRRIPQEPRSKPEQINYLIPEVLTSSNLQKSDYYQNLSMRAYIKEDPLLPSEMQSPRKESYNADHSGILNDFLLR